MLSRISSSIPKFCRFSPAFFALFTVFYFIVTFLAPGAFGSEFSPNEKNTSFHSYIKSDIHPPSILHLFLAPCIFDARLHKCKNYLQQIV
jgi:hypothetical protein